MIYGYCRISTKTQNIDRQERNIKAVYPDAHIIKETYTGTTADRPQWKKLLKAVKPNDTIIFDSVSRMSRNATEGIELYMDMYSKGINLVFLKEGYINTDVYKKRTAELIAMTGNRIADVYINATNEVLMILAKEQIQIAFEQAEKEVQDLRQRTKEGLVTAKLNGKRVGNTTGNKLTTKKSIKAKEEIKKYSKSFSGNLNDAETMKITGITHNTYYKYKRELMQELLTGDEIRGQIKFDI